MPSKSRLPKIKGDTDFSGARILILAGQYFSQEGVCLGRSSDPKKWAVSPDGENIILDLKFEEEFGLLIDLSGKKEIN